MYYTVKRLPVRGLMSKDFGKKLTHLRTEHKLTQAQLADRLGLASQAYVSNLEAGRKEPSLELVVRVATLFDVALDHLLRENVPGEGSLGKNCGRSERYSLEYFGKRLRQVRSERGISQAALARHLALNSRAYVSNIEAGRKLPSLQTIAQVADFFDLTTDYFVSPEF